MSWYLSKSGRADAMARAIKQEFEKVGGCPEGSAEEQAKNSLGAVAENLCSSLINNPIVSIQASGSAWTTPEGAVSQDCSFKFSLMGDFIE